MMPKVRMNSTQSYQRRDSGYNTTKPVAGEMAA